MLNKLNWCRHNAPDVYKNLPDTDLLNIMEPFYVKYVESITSICIPSAQLLDSWSFPVSLDKSTNKLPITDDIVSVVETDSHSYEVALMNNFDISNFTYRVKTPESIRRKVGRHPDLRFQAVFNDILGLRIKVPNYNFQIPSYLRYVDITKGKSDDDGYRAIHAYYKKSNNHYIIEIQFWSEEDYLFNLWSHLYAYKTVPSTILREIRNKYDKGLICSSGDFQKEVYSL